MYILSQDKKQLINLDKYTLNVIHNKIVCGSDVVLMIDELPHRVIGEYESTDRAK